jgi:2-methylisocitrate lyase-like PEP mutase family enzyme
MRGKEVIPVAEMAKKIEAGVKAKRDPDFIINARTDAIAVEGIAGTVARIKTYTAAGADMIYVDAIQGEDDIARAVEAAGDVPVNINMGFGVRSRPTSPLIPLKRLKELGVARVSVPRMLPAAALSGMRKALEVMQQCIATGEAADRPDLLASMEDITGLFDYERIAALETAFSLEEVLEQKYHAGERSYVVRAKDATP